MAPWLVPLADIVVPEEDIAVVADVYRSGWLSMGPRTEELEAALAASAAPRHALPVANCTVGLHLLCAAAGVGPGDEVIVPSLTFVATANAIRYTGATPVFADIAALDRPWLSVEAARAAIGPNTKAIMNMTYGGHPGESAELAELAAEHDLVLLEDTAHGLGGKLGERHLGTIGRAGAFSFFSNKNLPVGEGGMVVTDDDELAAQVRLLRSHGMTSLTWDRHRGHATGYDVVELGFNYRIDEPRAALATARLARLDAENARRAVHDTRYRRALAAHPELAPTAPPPTGRDDVPAHHLFTLALPAGADRDAVRAELARRGVQTSVHYPPVHRFSVYADSGAVKLPVTESYGVRTLTLPMFAGLTCPQIDTVVEA